MNFWKKSRYESFAKSCVSKLKVLQDTFKNDYDIDWYDNWFYNQSTGLLTFSSRHTELNFRYFDIGSFSTKSNTWKWSWDNDSTIESVRQEARIIKEFGQKSNFTKLTTGYFPSDEFEAWKFAAIAAELTHAIGIYRPVNDNGLQIFLAVTSFIDAEAAKKIKNKFIRCASHDYRRVAFVCQHLNNKTKAGFHEAFGTEDGMELSGEDDFQAWCDQCEDVRKAEDEWSEKAMAFANIKAICEGCYFEMKQLNLGDK